MKTLSFTEFISESRDSDGDIMNEDYQTQAANNQARMQSVVVRLEKTKEKKNEAVYGPSFNASFSLISSFQNNLGKCFLRMTEFEPHISCVGNNNGC